MSDASSNLDHEGRTIDFGRRAADYDRHRPGFPESVFDQLMDRGWLAPGQRVLDLGAGTGTLALGLAARGADVTGLDIAPELLEVARRRAADLGLSARFVEGAAESTGQADDSFDLVTAGQCWWWFDSDASIAEVTRVLGDGGRLVIGNFSYLPLGANVAARTEDLILTHNPGWPKAGSRGVHPEQVQALDRGGFVGVESFSYTVEVPFTHDSWRGRMRTCNGVGSALTDLEVEHFDHDLASMLMEEFGQHLLVPHRIFVTGGTLPRR